MQNLNLQEPKHFDPGMRSQNSFINNDMERTPRGSIHTTYEEQTEKISKTSGLSYMGLRPPGGIAGTQSAHNKIRVVIRMRPFLEGEQQELKTQSNV